MFFRRNPLSLRYNFPMFRAFLLAFVLFSLTSPARAEFGFHAGAHLGFGRMGDEAIGGYSDRSIGSFDLQVMPGYRLLAGQLLAGLMLDYRFVSQLTNAGQVGSNFSGNGFLLGLGTSIEPGPFKFLVSYDFLARHSIKQPESTLEGSGFHLLFGYKFLPLFYFDLELVTATYDNMSLDTYSIELPYQQSIRHWQLGLGISYSY